MNRNANGETTMTKTTTNMDKAMVAAREYGDRAKIGSLNSTEAAQLEDDIIALVGRWEDGVLSIPAPVAHAMGRNPVIRRA